MAGELGAVVEGDGLAQGVAAWVKQIDEQAGDGLAALLGGLMPAGGGVRLRSCTVRMA